ncbi:MAG: asparagine synthase-related protein [Steroidobacteraceae bacterium]
MYHYVVLIWSFVNDEAFLAAAALGNALEHSDPRWNRAFSSAGMRVYTQSPRTTDLREYPLPAARGVILGRLFPAKLSDLTNNWEPAISESDAARYLEAAGKLTEDYWGAYLAFLTSPTEPRSAVVRDPSGKLPCYRLRHADVDILFADVADLSALRLPPFTLNLAYLAAFIYRDSLQIRESAFAEVTEVLAGECVQFHGSSARQRTAWDPGSITTERGQLTYEQAVTELRRTTQACIDAWACVHPRVLHCLSGGLDSSIVLGCLSGAPSAPAIVCLNRYLEAAEGDERAYARIAAGRARVPLIERSWSPRIFAFGSDVLSLPVSAKPSYPQCGRLLELALTNTEAERHQADAMWMGQGGDHLFLKTSNVPSAADYVADHGLRCGLVRVVRDAARLSAQPYAAVLHSALSSRRARTRQAMRADQRKAYFVCPDALPRDLDRYSAHPWTLAAESLPPGRQCQIHLLAEVVNRHRPIPRKEFAYEHHPLLSQPIIEQCLRTPTYLHLRGGRHRALARDAFSDCVPAPILQREDKGNTTSFVVDGIRRNESFLCELLLDGILAREGLVDRAQLEACLREDRALMPGQLPPLTACIAAEVWARAWWRSMTRAEPVIPA